MKPETVHIHFIGIGGIGMSALAEMLYRQGYSISGSDQSLNDQTRHLQSLGITVFAGHQASQVKGDLVVYTPAIPADNSELIEAHKRGILCVKRAEMLGEVLRGKKCLAIAGTHGKTSTSAMTGMMMIRAGYDPILMVGGVLRDIGSNVRPGHGEWAVVEADEFDRSFLHLFPDISVINNIEPDHLDCYGNLEDLKKHFIRFANQTSVFGYVLVNADHEGSRSVIPAINRKVITYGLSPDTVFRASDLCISEGKTYFTVYRNSVRIGEFVLQIPGEHQVTNALACIGAGILAGVPVEIIREALANFRGTERRFEILGTKDGITWVDDYAHHPTEIRATLKTVRQYYPQKRIIAVFQPHLYSRTRDLMDEFASSFPDADIVWLTDIYAARELPPTGEDLNQQLRKKIESKQASVRYTARLNDLKEELLKTVQPGDVVITLGAGDITCIGRSINLRKEEHAGCE